MKTRGLTNQECAHLWAAQSQAEGHSQSMHFNGPVLYSYKTAIGVIVNPEHPYRGDEADVVLINAREYTMTTKCKHMPALRRAVTHMRSFTVPSMTEHPENLLHLVARFEVWSGRIERKRDVGEWCFEELQRHANDANDYARLFNVLPHTFIDAAARSLHIRGVRAEREARLNTPEMEAKRAKARAGRVAAKARKAECEAAERMARQAYALTAFRSGAPFAGYLIDENGGAYLRIREDVVETSRGASVLASDAISAIRFIRSQRDTGWAGSYELGPFTLTSVDPSGNIVAGCHFIKWSEIERIATELGV